MSVSDKFIGFAKSVLPAPFTIAVILTLVTFALVLIIQPTPPELATKYEVSMNGVSKQISPTRYKELADELGLAKPAEPKKPAKSSVIDLVSFWEKGFWDLLEFAMQMVLILILGHALALTRPVKKLINAVVKYCTTTISAVAIVAFATILVSLFNWGLGLVFGAILARKVGEQATIKQIPINYPMIGAAGYVGLMVWHGGLSGSAPLTVALPKHFLSSQIGQIPAEQTLFSPMNLVVGILLLTIIPAAFVLLARKQKGDKIPELAIAEEKDKNLIIKGAERLDHAKWLAYLLSLMMLGFAIYKAFTHEGSTLLSFLTLNYINFVLFGLCLALHGNITRFLNAIDTAVGGAAGIIIQFPIYAGIMGVMKYSGLIGNFSDFFISISNANTLPIFTFISAGIVNVFVPSGGGQWAVQGPIVVQSAMELGVSLPKNIMALAYGDQLTNMIQPFWALPLLGITGLKARDILPWSFIIMLVGIMIFLTCLTLF